MSDSVGAGGPSGSSGVLSSTMRSITRQAGDPQDREVRRVEDVVDLSPLAAGQERQQRAVEPAEPGDQMYNPGSQKNPLAGLKADKEADQADRAAREAERTVRESESEPEPVALVQPVNIGMAAAITIGAEDMVRRFDTNGDDHLDLRERDLALEAVQSDDATVPGGGRMFRRQAEVAQQFDGDGDVFVAQDAARRAEIEARREEASQNAGQGEAFLAEQESQKADAAQQRAVAEDKVERGRAERLAALEQQNTAGEEAAVGPRRSGADTAYLKSEELGLPQGAVSDVEA
ncbi:hypothetical protein F1188_17215 [Roseospira marina]|uniref:Uncharacterized protein n=1 Tax=Roseospira marina TaxID=140057 RepID=A0A5M6I8R5_9PROT|nr:hypothetical protein [Roseospira marina]KAA5604205.1 hypothetical protein F1188_17215 [Roseospira marina]MBB4315697.1 hypothetical protein [Roseospira marina]MBB5088809.1 hypothetical protein [Roseospira marina]